MQWMAFVHRHGGPQCHSAKSFKAKHFQCQPFLAALSLDCRMSLCGGFRVCAAGVVIYDTVGLQKVCTGGASCSQSRLLCMHHYISLARKSPCGYMCLGNFWADFRFCSQHSFGLTVSTCVAYWCLGCLRQISCPDACTHRHQDMHFCTFAIFYVRACAHSIGFLHQSLPNTKSATSCQVRDVGRSSFKTNLCLAPGLCVFDLFVLAGRVFLSSGLHVVVGRGRFGSGERRPCSFWVWILKQKSWTVELWWIMFLTSYDLRSLQSQLL